MDYALLVSQLRLKDSYQISEVIYSLGHQGVFGGDVEVAACRLTVVGGGTDGLLSNFVSTKQSIR